MMRISKDRIVNSTADNQWIDVQQTTGSMEKTMDDEATITCGKHVKKLITRQFGKNCKPAKFKLKQSDNDRGRFKIKLNDGSKNHTLKLSVDFKNSTVDMEYDNFKRQNSMTTWKRHSACGNKKKNESRPVTIEVQTENPDVQSQDECQTENLNTQIQNVVQSQNKEVQTQTEVLLQNPDIQTKTEQFTEIKLNEDVSTEINSNITDITNQNEISTDKEQLDTNACIKIGDNSFCYTKLKCERKEIEKQYGSTVLVGTPERWFTLNAAVPTYTNSEYNVSSSLFVNIERTPEHNSATFLHPVDKLKNEKIVELCHGALHKINTSSDQFQNLDDVSTNASLSTNSFNHVSDQNILESENKKTTPVQNEVTASNYFQTSEKNSEIKYEQAQAIQEEGCRRKKVTSKVKGQTRHVPQKPFYIITTQDEEFVRQLLLDFPLHDFVRKETNHFFRNEQKMHFTRPSVPIPSMHPLLPYKLLYLDEVETSEHHVIETSSAPTEPKSQDSDLHHEEEYFI
ncbi:uncharacterized protein LOC127724403 isoform X2 [Mytilus californianus]|uniref:uncharacterized protein LOC127724403 isoform X2 n=1 Tax=Mytilus californianus TaxID=6549 RepID=UPI002246F362|nr:uncharacterized protein LOC127724403 isoform X2 [Mytilus californianus]